jgi:hypothetical protein
MMHLTIKPFLTLLLACLWFSWAASAFAAYSLVANVAAGSSAGDDITTSSVNTTGANFLACGVSHYEQGGTPTISDSKGNTYVGLTQQQVSFSVGVRIYYVENATVGSGHTFTAAGSGRFASIACAAFSGGKTSASFDQQNGNFLADAVDIQPGSITPTENNELILSALGFGESDTITIDGGFTITNQIDFSGGAHEGVALAYLIQTTIAAANPTWDWAGTNAATAAAIASFKQSLTAAVTVRRAPIILR